MCLTLSVKDCIPRMAEEDILCDKVIIKPEHSDFIIAPYRRDLYLNVKYHVSVTLTAKIEPVNKTIWSKNLFAIYEGIHARVWRADRFRPKANSGHLITKAIIPKGTVYYTDGYDIVAEKMIIYNPFEIKP